MTESRVNSTLPDLDLKLFRLKDIDYSVLGQSEGRYTNRLITLGSGQGTYDKTRLFLSMNMCLRLASKRPNRIFRLPMSTITPGPQQNLLTHGY